ncbi:MAG: helix-turn-helix transcriptional regulator [Bacteroidaceae bacterium]|nr:helix-turn-helix transcriptional regulator [Bacteroidaceae bacterium]
MPNLSIAIIDSNMLVGIGLQQIIKDIMPADIEVFSTFEELKEVTSKKNFVHFFVASRIYFEHTAFFRDNARKSVILVNGDMQINGMRTLNVCQSEKMLVKSLLSLHGEGHGPGHPGPDLRRGEGKGHPMGHPGHPAGHPMMPPKHVEPQAQEQILSSREIEVAVLLAKGYINKEIADRLNISITTVNTHRTHIMEKLEARSLADVIVYCVMNGFVEVGDL